MAEPLTLKPAPHDVLLDLIQSKYWEYFDDIEIIHLWRSGMPRLPYEPVPSIYSMLTRTEVEQRNIPVNKTTKEVNKVKILYYTTNYSVLYKVQQVIKQIIVSNNKVSDTSQFKNTGIQWMQLTKFNYDVIHLGQEHVVYNLIASIDVVYQESYI